MFKRRRSFTNKRIKILSLLLILVLWLGVGYAYLSSTLTINGTGEIESNTWNVHFSNLEIEEGSVTAVQPPSVSGTNTTAITYSVNLSKPGDNYIFYVDVVNDGTIDAMLNELNITNLTEEQQKYLNFSITYVNGQPIKLNDKLSSGQSLKLKVVFEYKQDVEISDYPATAQTIPLGFSMIYVQAGSEAVEVKLGRAVTNSDIGKYVDLGKDVIGDAATTDDWRVLWVDETNNQTYLILADFLPTSKMPSATGITNNGSYSVYSTVDRDTLLNYMTTSSNWSSLIDSSIQGATVTGGPTKEVVEASYQAKYGGSWTAATAQADTLLVSYNARFNLCYWLASPEADYATYVWDVYYDGYFSSDKCSYTHCGVRPVVCLSSDTPLVVVE